MPPTPSPIYERLRDFNAKRMRMSHVTQTDFYAAPMSLISSGLWPMRRSA